MKKMIAAILKSPVLNGSILVRCLRKDTQSESSLGNWAAVIRVSSTRSEKTALKESTILVKQTARYMSEGSMLSTKGCGSFSTHSFKIASKSCCMQINRHKRFPEGYRRGNPSFPTHQRTRSTATLRVPTADESNTIGVRLRGIGEERTHGQNRGRIASSST